MNQLNNNGKLYEYRKEKENLKWKWYNFIGVFAVQICACVIFAIILWEIIKNIKKPSEEEEEKEVAILALVITLILSGIIGVFFTWTGYIAWEELHEKLMKEEISEATKGLKTELLETKTELLLVQNKLREEREKGDENK